MLIIVEMRAKSVVLTERFLKYLFVLYEYPGNEVGQLQDKHPVTCTTIVVVITYAHILFPRLAKGKR